jgi:LmbE family N-acetylglucosaminyl deacetylase
MKRILAFGCHPDDIEFMAAGTLALLAERGWEVHLATMTGGEVGSANRASHEIRATRLAEAEAAAKVLGAAFHYAGGYDLEVGFDHAYRRMATHVVRVVRPDVVLTHPPYDYLVDHEETSRLVRTATFIASVPLYDCGDTVAPTAAIPYLYYWDAFGGVDNFGRPLPMGFGVDVGSAIETKRRMLASHASQREWLAFVNSIDSYLDEMVRMTQAQGARIDRPYGECFLQHLGHGHPKDNILAQELGDLVVPIVQ